MNRTSVWIFLRLQEFSISIIYSTKGPQWTKKNFFLNQKWADLGEYPTSLRDLHINHKKILKDGEGGVIERERGFREPGGARPPSARGPPPTTIFPHTAESGGDTPPPGGRSPSPERGRPRSDGPAGGQRGAHERVARRGPRGAGGGPRRRGNGGPTGAWSSRAGGGPPGRTGANAIDDGRTGGQRQRRYRFFFFRGGAVFQPSQHLFFRAHF